MTSLLTNVLFLVIFLVVVYESAAISKFWDRPQRFLRIVGGRETQPHEYPSTSGLIRNGVLYCGATILSARHLLTAAHCIYNFLPTEIFVFVGGHKFHSNSTFMKKVSLALHHSHFNAASFDNDIGFVKTEKRLTFGIHAQPACLPKYSDFTEYYGKLGTVLGWGSTGENSIGSSVLRSIIIPIWSQNKCEHSGYGLNRLTTNMICAGYEEGLYDACQGDSGGPMLHISADGFTEIIGIISWGRGCGRPNFPGVYTIVSHYKNWINQVLSSENQKNENKCYKNNFFID